VATILPMTTRAAYTAIMTNSTHLFDAAMALERTGPDRFNGTTADGYWNFAGPFGGYLAALFMRAVMVDERRLGPPVAQTVNYCGPLAKGAFSIALKIARGGKATQHWSLELLQGTDIIATCSIVCANRRDTFAHDFARAPDVPPVEQVAIVAPARGLPWLAAYEFRFIEGRGPTFGAKPDADTLGPSRTVLWLRDHPARALDFPALASLSDCFILRLLQMRGVMVPMSTVSMTTYFHADEAELAAQGDAPLLGVADCKRVRRNFHDQQMELWSADRTRLLATGIQTVWFKE
jgi:acyl-coenzyme A thioesterase PaaI-like protein